MTAWKKNNVTKYYINNRSKYSELYLSESKLLNKLKRKKVKTVLDFGCATGNFYNIFKKMFGKIEYTGIDIEKEMIRNAVKKFKTNKETRFLTSNKSKLNFEKNSFDFTFSTSVLHHVKNYKKIIDELVRTSSKYIFIDSPRIHFKNNFTGKMNLAERFKTNSKKNNNVSYFVLNLKNYLNFLKKIIKKHSIKQVYFFCNVLPYSEEYMSFNDKIFYMTILLEKSTYKKKFKKILYTKDKEIKKYFRKF